MWSHICKKVYLFIENDLKYITIYLIIIYDFWDNGWLLINFLLFNYILFL